MEELINDINDTVKSLWFMTVYATSSGSKSAIRSSRILVEDLQVKLDEFMEKSYLNREKNLTHKTNETAD